MSMSLLMCQDNWDDLLPLTKFTYNNHMHFLTQHTPFLVDTVHHLQMGFEPHQQPSHIETVNEFADQMRDTLEEAKATLIKSKDEMAKVLQPAMHTCQVGNKVYVHTSMPQTSSPRGHQKSSRIASLAPNRHACVPFTPPTINVVHTPGVPHRGAHAGSS